MRFLIFIKPDAVASGSIGAILACFETAGFKIVRLQKLRASRELATAHYAEHEGKPFYEGLVAFTVSGDVVAAELDGDVGAARRLVGATDPAKADEGTIRRKYGTGIPANAIHCSADAEGGAREIDLWFPSCSRVPCTSK